MDETYFSIRFDQHIIQCIRMFRRAVNVQDRCIELYFFISDSKFSFRFRSLDSLIIKNTKHVAFRFHELLRLETFVLNVKYIVIMSSSFFVRRVCLRENGETRNRVLYYCMYTVTIPNDSILQHWMLLIVNGVHAFPSRGPHDGSEHRHVEGCKTIGAGVRENSA